MSQESMNLELHRCICGAMSKRTGQPCPLPPMLGRTRCKWHGGASTGPRTEAGKEAARINGKKGGRPRKATAESAPRPPVPKAPKPSWRDYASAAGVELPRRSDPPPKPLPALRPR